MERDLRGSIGRVRSRWFKLVLLRTIGRAAALAAVPIVAGIGIDGAFHLHGWPLILLAAAVAILSVAAAAYPVLKLERRPTDRLVARYIEERTAASHGPSMDDALVSAVDVTDGRSPSGSPGFTELIVAAAVRRLHAIDPADIIEPGALRSVGVQAAAGLIALAIALALGMPSLVRAVETVWIAAFPDTVQVEVQPGDVRVVAGQPLRITSTVRGKSGALTGLPAMLSVTAGNERRSMEMTRDGGTFRFEFTSVDRTFRYRVTAGTAASREYTVSAVFPPRVERIDVRYIYPSFSGLAPREEEGGGDVYAPAGTRVRLRVHADRGVASGELALAATPKVVLRPAGERVLEGELTLARDDSYRVHLADGDGLRGPGSTEYFIRVMDDRPPDVRIIRPSRDQQITPLEEVAIEARADDDYGISAFDLVYSVSGGPERAIKFGRVTGTDVQKTGSYLLPAEELGVQPGDVITYYARARDVGRGKRPTEAKSDLFFLEVKPFGEEFVAAQSQAAAGAGAGGTQIEALIAAQKEIINATWNIERRSGGGRSEADIKAIAEAQAELRARVEQMGRRSGRGGRDPFPQRLSAQPAAQPSQPRGQRRSGDPIGTAAAAMQVAQQQLESQRTREAIPHEMAALNALLQAQAEVRRRQVAQQRASGGGGGSNRSGEDLSALFDKELQRQQRTNYETRSQVEERPDRAQPQESALDRIRDLARRQEELNRRQRELAGANLSAEETKRRLERLTREQAELRQRAEELAKQQSQSGQGGSAMRDVSEQMRSAANDLRREDASSAAGKGERAAEQLRSLERQARGQRADGKQRAAGELQLEAQQIADAQRRMASDAERMEREGAPGTDAKRRLADEKDRLAGRVDELQRASKQAGQTEAAAELEREQVGQRMRETAKQMREGSRPISSEEQQLARTLDQVSEKLGAAATGADAQRLGDELKQTQAIRDRLNRLEQQMRAAEAKAAGQDARSQGARSQGAGGQEARGQRAGGRVGEGASSGGELDKLRAEYQRELQRARDALGRLQQGQQQRGGEGATPEQHEYSRSAPGTEQFKQDRSKWDSLRKDVDLALERYEAEASARLKKDGAPDRLSAGASDRVPDKYRDLVAKYFQSLATGRRK